MGRGFSLKLLKRSDQIPPILISKADDTQCQSNQENIKYLLEVKFPRSNHPQGQAANLQGAEEPAPEIPPSKVKEIMIQLATN